MYTRKKKKLGKSFRWIHRFLIKGCKQKLTEETLTLRCLFGNKKELYSL